MIKSNPNMAMAYNNLGVAMEKKGLVIEAKEQYQKALDLDPDYADAKQNLERLPDKKG